MSDSTLGLTNSCSRTIHDIHQRGIEFYDGASSTLAEVKKRTREIADEQECLYFIAPSE